MSNFDILLLEKNIPEFRWTLHLLCLFNYLSQSPLSLKHDDGIPSKLHIPHSILTFQLLLGLLILEQIEFSLLFLIGALREDVVPEEFLHDLRKPPLLLLVLLLLELEETLGLSVLLFQLPEPVHLHLKDTFVAAAR